MWCALCVVCCVLFVVCRVLVCADCFVAFAFIVCFRVFLFRLVVVAVAWLFSVVRRRSSLPVVRCALVVVCWSVCDVCCLSCGV